VVEGDPSLTPASVNDSGRGIFLFRLTHWVEEASASTTQLSQVG